MISAPRSSSASWVRALTEACVPTGMKKGVATVPWGVVRRPRRAPVGSVFNTSKKKIHLQLNTAKEDRQECLSYCSVSGEDERHSDAHSFIRRPNDEGYSDGPSRFELLGIEGCESD